MKKKIVLVGMMGCGKSTMGKILSNKLEIDFIDTDKLIEKKIGLKIKTIFKKYNEAYFRNKEEKIISKLLLRKKVCVIALGGGSLLNKKIRKIVLKKTISIWLNTKKELILKRCNKSNERPLLTMNNSENHKIINNLLKIRKPLYSKAKIMIRSNKSQKIVSEQILKKIKKYI
tara:strand:- start:59 stop:577 length:519 start_codon:yes stop_codon:yes gene_type:complete